MIKYDPHIWTDHIFDIKGSMVREIIGRVFACVLWSIFVIVFHYFVTPVDFPSTAHSLVGIALGLLLVFRTNASYDRFWEGRRLWGGMVNESRNLARLAKVTLHEDPKLYNEIVHWIIAFSYATMQKLRGNKGFGPLQSGLSKTQIDDIFKFDHHPIAVSIQISTRLNEAKKRGIITDFVQMTLDQNVQLLIDYIGACERIVSTPLPFAYVVHLRRALLMYFFSVPFALVDAFGWITPLVSFLIAYIFFGIEEIGVEIEDPFGEDDNDLPLERICQTIESNLLELLIKPGEPTQGDHIRSLSH